VLAISARDPQATKDAAMAAGARGFVSKPIDYDDLLAQIREALG
jgi:DNA-binding NarL/FixJ family response regulator